MEVCNDRNDCQPSTNVPISNETTEKVSDHAKELKATSKYLELAKKVGISIEDIEQRKYSQKHLKRILKTKQWEASKEERRRITREKRKKKKGCKPKVISMKDSPNKVCIGIDLSLESYMNDKELRKLMKQLQRCYSINRRSEEPCQYYLTSVIGRIQESLYKKQPGFKQWDVNEAEKHYLDVFSEYRDKKNLIFLSSDSPNVLPESEELKKTRNECVYMIGGLVDHNVHKGLTLKLANEAGIRHARLPIDEYVKIYMTKVLAVNHVFEIMLLATQGVGWEEAFKRVIPQRKFNKPSSEEESSESDTS